MSFLSSALLLVLAASSLSCSGPSQQAATVLSAADTIFRYVTIGPNVPVRLGEPLPALARPFLEPLGSRAFVVRAGMFSGAQAIRFELDGDGNVTSVAFSYDPAEEGFRAKVDSYAESLGSPEIREANGIRVARWQDQRTRFEVVEHQGRLEALLSNLTAPGRPVVGADVPRSST